MEKKNPDSDGSPRSIRSLQEESHALALSKGWWPNGTGKTVSVNEILSKIALIHSELSEALEVIREKGTEADWIWFVGRSIGENLESLPKPEGFGIELADAVIRIMDICGSLKIDLEKCIITKMHYNKTRPHRHGGKKA
jgi:NTP pyrophosphatase (non-canonical NTP hydrolase)